MHFLVKAYSTKSYSIIFEQKTCAISIISALNSFVSSYDGAVLFYIPTQSQKLFLVGLD